MNPPIKIDYRASIDITKKITHPFSREVYMGKMKEELGEGSGIWYDMGHGIALAVREFVPRQEMVIFEQSDVAGAVFIFNLGSDLRFVFKDQKEHLLKKNRFLVGLASTQFYVETPFSSGQVWSTLTTAMKQELFLELATPIKNIQEHLKEASKHSYSIFQDRSIDPKQLELLRYLQKRDSYEETLESIHLESKATELIHYTIERMARALDDSSLSALEEGRLSSLERAREIILQDYHNPHLSIKEIAYRSAINECYLKRDFKKHYGMTILEMIQRRRLEVAKELLHERLTLKEVAQEVGYRHVGHFSKLFSERFGITPSDYKKELRNF